jgi:hypothetical protein
MGYYRSAAPDIAYCPHGAYPCVGNPDRGLPPCTASEHHYCAHGYDQRLQTSEHEPRCPDCRGVTARQRNPDTYSAHRRTTR